MSEKSATVCDHAQATDFQHSVHAADGIADDYRHIYASPRAANSRGHGSAEQTTAISATFIIFHQFAFGSILFQPTSCPAAKHQDSESLPVV